MRDKEHEIQKAGQRAKGAADELDRARWQRDEGEVVDRGRRAVGCYRLLDINRTLVIRGEAGA